MSPRVWGISVNQFRASVARHWHQIKHFGSSVRHAIGRTALVRGAVHLGRSVAHAAKAGVHAVGTGLTAAAHFAEHHAATIGSLVASGVTFMGCEAAVTFVTGGALTAPGAIACGALAGAVGNAVGYSIGAMQNHNFSWSGLASSAGQGALAGAAGGMFGAIGGKVVSGIASSAGRAVAGVATGAAGGAAIEAGTELATTGHVNARSVGIAALIGGVSSVRVGRGGCHSFAPTTRVLLASGATVAISSVALGATVTAFDPATGQQVHEKVVALHLNHDTDLTDVTLRINARSDGRKQAVNTEATRAGKAVTGAEFIRANAPPAPSTDGAEGQLTVVHTTSSHMFWDGNRRQWTPAIDLRAGTRLVGPDGATSAEVVRTRSWTGKRAMYDLTIDRAHTYYVMAGATAVLVHNCGSDAEPDLAVRNDMANSGMRPGREGKADTTQAGLEYDKHQLKPG